MDSRTFIEHYLEHTKDYESPTSFWYWSAITAISGVCRDNCYRRLGDEKLHPNIYTLLLADSAVHRKGHPVKLCEKLVEAAKSTKVISGRSSIQGILDELAKSETDKTSGKIIGGGSALFSAPELSAGIVNDPEAIKILTDIYDYKDNYVSRLRGSGIFRIKNVCFTMMGASNEELLKDIYDTKALFGGLLGRTFLVKPNEFRKGNSLFDINDTSASFQGLLDKLTSIGNIRGEFQFSDKARIVYDDWYYPFRNSYKGKADKSGVAGRIHTSVLKVAMILCLNMTKALYVDEYHIRESIRVCTSLMPNYTGFVMATGKASISDVLASLIEEVWVSKEKQISKPEFLTRYFHRFELEVIDKAIDTGQQAGLLVQHINTHNSEISYTITEKSIKLFGLKEEQK